MMKQHSVVSGVRNLGIAVAIATLILTVSARHGFQALSSDNRDRSVARDYSLGFFRKTAAIRSRL
jgi:hypothetical protein